MPRSKAAEARRTVPRFRYTPGDGHVYVWSEGMDVIKVFRIGVPGRVMSFLPTGDTIPVPEVATATALADAVQAWKATRRP